MSQTATKSATYTDADVVKCIINVRADLLMIGSASGAWVAEEARKYADDIETLAKAGYIDWVDVALFDGSTEQCAVRYMMSGDASGWTSSRPGGVLWPRLANPQLQVVISPTPSYTATAQAAMRPKLKINWGPSDADTSHSGLQSNGGRDYASNAFGIARKDWKK